MPRQWQWCWTACIYTIISLGVWDAGEMHIHCSVHLGQIAIGHHLGRLVADTNLEARRAPVHKLDGSFSLEHGHGCMDILGHHITTVQETRRHVLAVARITLDHLVVGFEARLGNLLHRVGLVGRLGSRDNGRICHQGEVDAGIRHQVGLELVQIDVEGTIETKGGSDGGHDWTG